MKPTNENIYKKSIKKELNLEGMTSLLVAKRLGFRWHLP